MKKLILLAAVVVSGCEYPEGIYRNYYGEPEVIGSGNGTVQIRSGFSVDPSATAKEACGGSAELLRTEPTDLQGQYSVSYWRCS